MFTFAQIDDLHARLGRADRLADYLRELAAIGVARFDSYVTDGHSEFFNSDGQCLVSPAHHEVLDIAESSDRDAFLAHLRRSADTAALTMTYRDRAGVALLVEQVG